jgi:hypothetical protein
MRPLVPVRGLRPRLRLGCVREILDVASCRAAQRRVRLQVRMNLLAYS